MDTIETKPTMPENGSLTEDLPKNTRISSKVISVVIVLSLIFGAAGAVLGNQYLMPWLKKTSAFAPLTSGDVKTVQVDEQSGVIDVVKQASPAVVSIIISKDLNQIQGDTSSGFDFGPFSLDPFFQNRSSQPDSNSTPNVQEIGGGSGFIIRSDGLIVTNKHVVEDTTATYTVLTNDGKEYPAQVLSRDPTNDIALVKIDAQNMPTITLGDSGNLQIGQTVIAIGNSLGEYRNTVTSGIVSGIGRTITAGGTTDSEQLEGVIQTDAAINPGNSGGPLLDIGGSVIGINTAIDQEGQLVGFAIPVNDIKNDLNSFNKNGQIIKPFLGVRYVLVNDTVKQQNNLSVDYGALITGDANDPAVVAGSAAAKAGLKSGDIILEVNGQKVDEDHSLAAQLKNFNAGDTVKMKVQSGDSTKDINVTLGQSQ
ncbi:MAG TPA: trypsin-like peptidase domain-containing protein [Patescibacteria group bacterium]|nr:trypsin-like peptidase domain-containing protein [Patescibacteria group bacterium]